MANEVTVTASLGFVKGNADVSLAFTGVGIDVTGTKFVQTFQTIGTSAEQVEIGDMTTPGLMLIKNNATANFVEFRDGSGGADVVKLKAGEVCLFRPTVATLFAISDTASSEIEFLLVED